MTPTRIAIAFGLVVSMTACSSAGTPMGSAPIGVDGGASSGSQSGDAADGNFTPDAAVGDDDGTAQPSHGGDDAGNVGAVDGGATRDGGPAADAGANAPLTRVAIPMYVDPSTNPSLWSEVRAAGAAVGLVVMNPDNGPTSSADSDYTTALASGHAAGQLVIGYVHSQDAARAIVDVEADVDTYYAQYPGIDGIFVDEVSDDLSTVASYYAPLYAHIKAKAKSVTVVINPGTMVDESFMKATDILLSWEDTYADYVNTKKNAPPPAWVQTYPASRFWNIIHTTPAANEADAIARAKSANVGWIYVTAEGPDTAYQAIETGAYWTTELSLVTAP